MSSDERSFNIFIMYWVYLKYVYSTMLMQVTVLLIDKGIYFTFDFVRTCSGLTIRLSKVACTSIVLPFGFLSRFRKEGILCHYTVKWKVSLLICFEDFLMAQCANETKSNNVCSSRLDAQLLFPSIISPPQFFSLCFKE